MFDASEILFLNSAVELNLLTPNQRDRLMEFQDQLEPGYTATQLVVDAGVMVEEEVTEVLDALQLGMSQSSNGPAPGVEASSPNAPKHVATPTSVSRQADVSVATSFDVDAIINDAPAGSQQPQAQPQYQRAAPQAEYYAEAEAAEQAPQMEGQPQHFDEHEYASANQPAFPIPGGGISEYAGDGPDAGDERDHGSIYGSQDDINAEWEALDEDEQAAIAPPAPVQQEVHSAKKLASSADEIASLLDGDGE